jgi:hypothetical protein
MSVRERILVIPEFDIEKFVAILKDEHEVSDHPSQEDALLADDLPFYRPDQTEDYVYVVSFNHRPLPGLLLEALVNHPELVSDETLIFWTIEQEIYLETTVGDERGKAVQIDPELREKWREYARAWILLL